MHCTKCGNKTEEIEEPFPDNSGARTRQRKWQDCPGCKLVFQQIFRGSLPKTIHIRTYQEFKILTSSPIKT